MPEESGASETRPRTIPKEKDVAERWLRMKGVRKPQEKSAISGLGRVLEAIKGGLEPMSVPAGVVQEAYDLFAEKDQLNSAIVDKQRNEMEPGRAGKTLTFQEKKDLISKGRIGTLLAIRGPKTSYQEVVGKSQQRVKEIDTKLDEAFSKPGVYEAFTKDLSRQIRTRRDAKEAKSLEKFTEDAVVGMLQITRSANVEGRSLTSVEEQAIGELRELQGVAASRREELSRDPEVFDRMRLLTLQEYQQQLRADGFAETPSRTKSIQQLEALWSQNKKVLITGPTGTGKTELVKHAAGRLFEVKPYGITGHRDMTPYELLGRTGMSIKAGEGSDVYRPSKLVQAMVARDGRGAPFLYDEMDASPNEANIALKTLLNDGPGDKISIQMDGDKVFAIGPDYSFTGTANVKSEKHASRFEVDPAIVRVLEPMILPYMPPAEVWDICVSSLLDKRGGLPLGQKEAASTLRNLCDAASWIQKAYLGERVVTDATSGSFLEARGGATTGRQASLKEALLDPGRVVRMMKGWEGARAQGANFKGFLETQLIQFINNENFPEEDRYYLVEIFALKGFFKGQQVSNFHVSGLDQVTFERWTGGAVGSQTPVLPEGLGNLVDGAQDKGYLRPEQVAKLDPYKRFKRPSSKDAEDLLGEEDEKVEVASPQIILPEKIRNLKAAVGAINTKDSGKAAHVAYLNKLEEIGQLRSATPEEKKGAIAALEEYNKIGGFDVKSAQHYDPDGASSLREQALEKAGDVRSNIILRSMDLDEIKEFVGDITKEYAKKPHVTYISAVLNLGNRARDANVVRKAIQLLEEYGSKGYFNKLSPHSWEPDSVQTLRQQANENASQLRVRLMSLV